MEAVGTEKSTVTTTCRKFMQKKKKPRGSRKEKVRAVQRNEPKGKLKEEHHHAEDDLVVK